jgi:plasmid maintenance system antidote protein VapI
LKKVELPSVEEFQKRVEQRADAIDVSPEEVSQLVHEARGDDE